MKSIYEWLEKFNLTLISHDTNYFTDELKKEVAENHFLFEKELISIAKDDASDDVIFSDGISYYIVHLTYSIYNEEGFPKYKYFKNMEELKKYLSNKNSINRN